jgi:PBSX family phage terminase large subunit
LTTYNLVESKTDGVTLRGGALALWKCKDHEAIIVGPAETGKTFGALTKLNALCWKYPGVQAAIVRKTYKSTVSSVVQTFTKKIILPGSNITPYGGERPDWFDYPNGSRIWIGGMDSPDKVLSSERDFIYVNQAEELQLQDWETLTTRCTGRAGNSPYAQLFGDANPSTTLHWIRQRANAENLTYIRSVHKDNPLLFDDDGNLTDQGRLTITTLQSLTGVRRKRLYEGEWATAEGAVYDMFSTQDHVKERDLAEFREFGLAMDEGYTNPAVILLIGIDSDGRWHVISEFYQRGVLQRDVVDYAVKLTEQYGVSVAAVDAAAAGLIAELQDNNVPAEKAKGRVQDGIYAIQDRLKIQPDGRPRLTISPECINVINEFESYIWKPEKDEPVKENDHAMDALRYFNDANGETWLISS